MSLHRMRGCERLLAKVRMSLGKIGIHVFSLPSCYESAVTLESLL